MPGKSVICESDLWFRLLVMHVYHAGAGNVKAVLIRINPKEGQFAVDFFQLWQTEAGKFRNASQNYSQVLITALIRTEPHVREDQGIRGNVLFSKNQIS